MCCVVLFLFTNNTTATAYVYSGDPLFSKAFDYLLTQNYHKNIINAKVTSPSDLNYRFVLLVFVVALLLLLFSLLGFVLLCVAVVVVVVVVVVVLNFYIFSDDNLMYLAYFTFCFSGGDKFVKNEFDVSIDRSWNIGRVRINKHNTTTHLKNQKKNN